MKYYIQESNLRTRWSNKYKEVRDSILQQTLLKMKKTVMLFAHEFTVSSEELDILFDIFQKAGYDMYLYKFEGIPEEINIDVFDIEDRESLQKMIDFVG